MMLTEYLWFWIGRAEGDSAGSHGQLSWFRKMYQDIWGIRASLEEQFAD